MAEALKSEGKRVCDKRWYRKEESNHGILNHVTNFDLYPKGNRKSLLKISRLNN